MGFAAYLFALYRDVHSLRNLYILRLVRLPQRHYKLGVASIDRIGEIRKVCRAVWKYRVHGRIMGWMHMQRFAA